MAKGNRSAAIAGRAREVHLEPRTLLGFLHSSLGFYGEGIGLGAYASGSWFWCIVYRAMVSGLRVQKSLQRLQVWRKKPLRPQSYLRESKKGEIPCNPIDLPHLGSNLNGTQTIPTPNKPHNPRCNPFESPIPPQKPKPKAVGRLSHPRSSDRGHALQSELLPFF